ncbi:hypothetical protein CAQU_10060 [Corynebacterium aquilae DSM 44791]|uniref:Glucitol operon activator n=1 Tax=Corynebacterium aquilae DSM 44791 TaxID=1431546 RepID=A0A1L7CHM0_9CORY|nr:hypothetical protein CAQU_10060 [Corynebacterium aquilae DSM 44791]
MTVNDTSGSTTSKTRRKPKPAHLVLLALVFAACLGLSWWQWTRFESGNGSFQNLGYALQWPVYGVVAIIAYRKVLAYEDDLEESDEAPVTREMKAKGEITQIDEDFLPQRKAVSVEEFNAMNRPTRRRGPAADDIG